MKNTFQGIDHVGWTVPDLEAATQFLERAFGAQVIYDSHLKSSPPQAGAGVEQQLGLPPGGQVIQIRLLRLANGASLELFEVARAQQQSPATIVDLSFTHIGLYVEDMAAATQRFEAAGGRLLSAPHPLKGVEAGPGNEFVYGHTPWGALIELLTYPAGVHLPNPQVPRWTPAA
ncbi:VOC family protein [Hymenobacter setariae]|uniref:VOC family protein n=1 Tax=Hymenobacter setariae TaxID=2594794 RepID=A0A558BLE1_9BACT|nr:VOC family protein [Hymenobacter setariae]TVT37328.1 VOC family protein [Hymenobacter setariae]